MPPESLDNYEKEIFTQTRDIWACGVVMYYVTYFRHPFFENSKMKTNLNIYEGNSILQHNNENLLKFEFMKRQIRFKNAIRWLPHVWKKIRMSESKMLVFLPSIEIFVIWFVNWKLEFYLVSFLSTNFTNPAWNWRTKKWKQKKRLARWREERTWSCNVFILE